MTPEQRAEEIVMNHNLEALHQLDQYKIIADAITKAVAEKQAELDRVRAELEQLKEYAQKAIEAGLEEKESYDTLVGLLKKRFPRLPNGNFPDYAIEDVLKENDALKLKLGELDSGIEEAEREWGCEVHSEKLADNIVKENYAKGVVSGLRMARNLLAAQKGQQ